MKKNYLFKFLSAALLVIILAFSSSQISAQVTITQWTFEGDLTTPATGSGTAALIGGTTATFATGVSGSPDRAWNSSAYPAQGEGSGTAGVEFLVSTAGYNTIAVTWAGRHSNTSANRIRLQYTLNGTDWVNFNASGSNAQNTVDGVDKGFDNGRYIADAGDTWYLRAADFSSISGAADNASFGVRIVSEFATATEYAPSDATKTYSPNGTLRYDNVTFAGLAGSTPLISASTGTLSGFTYVTGNGPSASQTLTLSGFNLTPATGTITLDPNEDFEISVDGNNYMGYYQFPYENGAFSNYTVYVRMKSGLAEGNYNGTLDVLGGGASGVTVSLSGSVTSATPPQIASIILPMYIQGAVPNTSRVPFAFHASISNLIPSATYRYYNKIVLASDAADYNGAGNCIFVDAASGTFTRTSSTSLGTAGQYGEFTTDASGSYAGWFITEPTGNATRFKPGAELFARIMLNDGAGGTTEVTRLTSSESFKVLGFYTNASDTTGTAIRGISNYMPKNFVFIYNNAEGTGRPLYGTQIEGSGIDFAATASYAAFYNENVAGTAGAWGGIVPNNNANGVKRVEERSLTTGEILSSKTSANGIWGTVDTKNPAGGTETVLILNSTLGINTPAEEVGKIYTSGKTLFIKLNNPLEGMVQVVTMTGKPAAEYPISGSEMTVHTGLPSGVYLVRIYNGKISVSSKVVIR